MTELGRKLNEFPEDLARMRYVGRLGEVLYLRLRNAALTAAT